MENTRKPFFRKPLLLLTAAVCSFSFAVAPSPRPAEAAAAPDPFRLVVLGDSVAVGYEHKMTETSAAYGYFDRLYEQALFRGRAEAVNYGVMGLTTDGLTSLLQGAADKRPLTSSDLQDFATFDLRAVAQADSVAAKTPEISASLAAADAVVLTIGGNDFKTFLANLIPKPQAEAEKILHDSFDGLVDEYIGDLETMATLLRQLAPEARIYLADQYLPLWKAHPLYEALSAAVDNLAAKLDDFAERMNEAGIPLDIVHLSDNFYHRGSELTSTAMFDGDIHPNQKGYMEIAKEFAAALWSDGYRFAPTLPNNQTINVIINGKPLASHPTLVKNTTFVPFRDVANLLGATIKWEQAKQTATFSKDGKVVAITIGAKTMTVNGVVKPVPVPAYSTAGKTYVPLAVITSGLDYQVEYRGKIKTAFINS